MKKRFRLIRRNIRGGKFYLVDTLTGKRKSLKSANASDAERILNARNEAQHQPTLNLHIAKAYLAGTDSGITTRTWQNALTLIDTKHGSTKERWQRAAKEKPLDLIRNRIIIETQAEHLLAVLSAGTVSTNVHLRKIHNFCRSTKKLSPVNITRNVAPSMSCAGISVARKVTLPDSKPMISIGKITQLHISDAKPRHAQSSISARQWRLY